MPGWKLKQGNTLCCGVITLCNDSERLCGHLQLRKLEPIAADLLPQLLLPPDCSLAAVGPRHLYRAVPSLSLKVVGKDQKKKKIGTYEMGLCWQPRLSPIEISGGRSDLVHSFSRDRRKYRVWLRDSNLPCNQRAANGCK